ncbi:MAG: hypothetical protein U9Q81_10990 [Pseudomonadota bacterium]|nr:hypothetical protein [Pseudomonadota bacterium]
MKQKTQPASQVVDDFDLALAAMERAAKMARKRALQRDGKLVVWREGRIVQEPVADLSGPQERSD